MLRLLNIVECVLSGVMGIGAIPQVTQIPAAKQTTDGSVLKKVNILMSLTPFSMFFLNFILCKNSSVGSMPVGASADARFCGH